MSYSLIIPPDLVVRLYFVREKTGVSIRRQILDSIRKHLDDYQAWKERAESRRHSALQNLNGKLAHIGRGGQNR